MGEGLQFGFGSKLLQCSFTALSFIHKEILFDDSSAFSGSGEEKYPVANPSLSVSGCSINKCSFFGNFHELNIRTGSSVNSFVANSTFEQRLCKRFDTENSLFLNCEFTCAVDFWGASGTHFRNCIWNPKISGSILLVGCRFDGSTVYISDWVNVAHGKDSTNLLSAKHVIDSWATLREEYTGLRLSIILLLTLLFFSPYILKAGSLLLLASIPTSGFEISYSPLWKELLFDGCLDLTGTITFIQFIFLLAYTGARFATTLKVSQAREREEHLINSGFAQSRPSPENIAWNLPLFRPITVIAVHSLLKIAFYISVAIGISRLIVALFKEVPVLL